MRVKRDPRSNTVLTAERIVHRGVLVSDCEVGARLEALIIWYFTHIPRSQAAWISVITARDVALRAIEIAMVVQLLARVVFLDGLAAPFDIVDTVFDAVDGAGDGLLGDTDAVA